MVQQIIETLEKSLTIAIIDNMDDAGNFDFSHIKPLIPEMIADNLIHATDNDFEVAANSIYMEIAAKRKYFYDISYSEKRFDAIEPGEELDN